MRVVILEDEKLNADRLIQLLEQVNPEIKVLSVIESVKEAVEWFSRHKDTVDMSFMDIQLSDGNCFEIFDQIRIKIPIIFTTAYNEFALKAFQVHSIDYLIKPVEKSELKRALNKLNYFKQNTGAKIDVSQIAEAFYRQENTRFIGRLNSQIVYVKAKDIAYVYYTEGIAKAITFKTTRVPLDYSLDQMEKLLNKSLFFRINRKTIVNIDAVEKINSYYNSRLVLQLQPQSDITTIVSRERVAQFKSWLEGKSAF